MSLLQRDILKKLEALPVTPILDDGKQFYVKDRNGYKVDYECKNNNMVCEEVENLADSLCFAPIKILMSVEPGILPDVQKEIAAKCRAAGKPFMVVTQMLDSMHERAVPTRAEVLDIYNAALDGAASLMLTGETAAGKFPVESMEYLVKTGEEARM